MGHAYAGHDDLDQPIFHRSGKAVATWLAHNYRVRFNQQRSLRKKYVYEDQVRLLDAEGEPVLVPIGETVSEFTHAQAKAQLPWMSSMPSMVLHHALRSENESWFAAVKRRKTNATRGRAGGKMPRFKSKHEALTFGCYARNGKQEILSFQKTGRRSGIISLRGFNPKHTITPEHPRVWTLRIRVRFPASLSLNPFTSILVNLSQMSLVLVGEPPVRERTPTGKSAGVDRGVHVVMATNHGELLNPSEAQAQKLKSLGQEYRANQRRMARSQIIAEREGRDFHASRRYQNLKTVGRKLKTRANNILNDWRQKTTTQLVADYDYLAVEKLNVKNMTRSATGTLEKPSKNVAQKRGLNRGLATSAPSTLLGMILYKAKASTVHVVEVPPQYTSQRCNACGHIQAESRKNQAFHCLNCAHLDHADINAAKNILDRALRVWDGTRSNRARTHKTRTSMLALAASA